MPFSRCSTQPSSPHKTCNLLSLVLVAATGAWHQDRHPDLIESSVSLHKIMYKHKERHAPEGHSLPFQMPWFKPIQIILDISLRIFSFYMKFMNACLSGYTFHSKCCCYCSPEVGPYQAPATTIEWTPWQNCHVTQPLPPTQNHGVISCKENMNPKPLILWHKAFIHKDMW